MLWIKPIWDQISMGSITPVLLSILRICQISTFLPILKQEVEPIETGGESTSGCTTRWYVLGTNLKKAKLLKRQDLWPSVQASTLYFSQTTVNILKILFKYVPELLDLSLDPLFQNKPQCQLPPDARGHQKFNKYQGQFFHLRSHRPAPPPFKRPKCRYVRPKMAILRKILEFFPSPLSIEQQFSWIK